MLTYRKTKTSAHVRTHMCFGWYVYIYIYALATQEHPAKYFSAHICPRPFWNPVKFQHYFKKSHHRQPPQILIDITCVFHIHFDSSLAQFGFCSPLIYDDRYEVRQVWQFRQIWQVWRVGHTAAEASSKGPAACEED